MATYNGSIFSDTMNYGAETIGNNLNGLAGNDTIIGGSGNDTIDGGSGNDSMTGGLGDDWYIVDAALDKVVENAGGGTDTIQTSVSGLVLSTFAAQVENLVMSGTAGLTAVGNTLNNTMTGNTGNNSLNGAEGNDNLFGGAGNDTLIGGTGNDSLDGGTGNDSMVGGTGNDAFVIDSATDLAIENAGEGTDALISSISVALNTAAFANIENVSLTGTAANATGSTANNLLIGNASVNTLSGLDGDDTLVAGGGNDILLGGIGNDSLDGGTGNDALTGGTGNDIYVIDSATDVVTELAGEGTDLIQASVSLALNTTALANIENLILTGTAASATGNTLNNILTGNALANTLSGLDGDDFLVGGDGNDTLLGGNGNDSIDGGLGNDSMVGGIGNDTYVVDSATDIVVEVAGEGTDTIQSSLSYSLNTPQLANVERLTLTGATALTATGNALNNLLIGNALDNVLDGGLGNDTLSGGAGNDTYIVDSDLDLVNELSNNGTLDIINASVTYALNGAVDTGIEELRLTGTANINATGDGRNNVITGNSGNNVLDGAAGDDTLTGGDGNDTYYVEQYLDGNDVLHRDLVVEGNGAASGTDTVITSAQGYTLGANVENLTQLGGGVGRGNSLNNVITGSSLNDYLDGAVGNDTILSLGGDDIVWAGEGNDSVDGGDGNDTILGDSAYQQTGTPVAGNDVLSGGNGNDSISGEGGNDTLLGGAGNDVLDGGDGVDSMTGGDGNDTYYVTQTLSQDGELFFDKVVEDSTASSGIDTVVVEGDGYVLAANVENMVMNSKNGTGNALNNLITGMEAPQSIGGRAGNDTILAMDGDDYLFGGDGSDSLDGGDGSDEIYGDSDNNLLDAIPGTPGAFGNDILRGGNGNDALLREHGNDCVFVDAGNDDLIGGLGNDTLVGGEGDDTYYVDSTADVVNEAFSSADDGGIDTVSSSISYALGTLIENLTLTGTDNINGVGNALGNALTGNAGNNILTGNDGDDILDGGLGNDIMVGGNGSDMYIVDSNDDVVTETGDVASYDEVYAGVSYSLVGKTGIEGVSLTGTGNINVTGNADANGLAGNTGNNILDGGAGNDTLVGGDGNDTYYVDSTGDQVYELLVAGDTLNTSDTVYSSVTFNLNKFGTTGIENLYLTGTADVGNTGNALDNRIEGNSGNNALNGAGGNDYLFGAAGNDSLNGGTGNDNLIGDVGNDTLVGDIGDDTLNGGVGTDSMTGGDGNDIYYVDAASDIIVEANTVGAGTDTVFTGINGYQLLANFENLSLQGTAGQTGLGNSVSNVLTGNAGNDALSGFDGDDTLNGGLGIDTLNGGNGNDTYYVDDVYDINTDVTTYDVVQEDSVAGSGIDTVITASESYRLANNVENLVMQGKGAG